MANIPVPNSDSQANKLHDPSPALNAMQTTLDTFLSAARVEAVYGPPVTQGENVVIPAAEVLSIAGFGVGLGGGSERAADPEKIDRGGGGGGGGGGGRVLSRPVAAIIMSPGGVRVEPIVDVTKIALATFTTLGFMVAILNRMTSRRRRLELDNP